MRNLKESPVEKYRHQADGMESPIGEQFGTFVVPLLAKPGAKPKALAICLVNDGASDGWERVTIEMGEKRRSKIVSRPPRLDEVATIKDLFWHEYETVCWFIHSAETHKATKANQRFTLWKPRGEKLNIPPQEILG